MKISTNLSPWRLRTLAALRAAKKARERQMKEAKRKEEPSFPGKVDTGTVGPKTETTKVYGWCLFF